MAAALFAKYSAMAMKILSRDIPHKSDVGGVRLDLRDVAAVGRAYDETLATVAARCPEAPLVGVTLQPMIERPRGIELIAGLSDDPTFGPVVVFGHGNSTSFPTERSVRRRWYLLAQPLISIFLVSLLASAGLGTWTTLISTSFELAPRQFPPSRRSHRPPRRRRWTMLWRTAIRASRVVVQIGRNVARARTTPAVWRSTPSKRRAASSWLTARPARQEPESGPPSASRCW